MICGVNTEAVKSNSVPREALVMSRGANSKCG